MIKLKAIAVYQSVKFNNKQEMYFAAAKPGMQGLEMSYEPKGGYAIIRLDGPNGADEIMVFSTNIAYAVPVNANTTADLAAEPKLRDIRPK